MTNRRLTHTAGPTDDASGRRSFLRASKTNGGEAIAIAKYPIKVAGTGLMTVNTPMGLHRETAHQRYFAHAVVEGLTPVIRILELTALLGL